MPRPIPLLALAAALLAVLPARAADEDKALKFVAGADGTATRDATLPGKPVVAVRLKKLECPPPSTEKPAGLAVLADFPHLAALDLSETEIYDPNLGELAALPNLRSLTVARCMDLRDGGGAHLARLDKLTTLDMSRVIVSNEVVKHLSGHKGLTTLNLSENVHITLDGVRLEKMTALASLNLSGTGVRDAGLKSVAELGALATPDLSDTRVTDTGLKELTGLAKLGTVRLVRCRAVGDPGVEQLAALKGLRELDLTRTAVTDKGLKALAGVEGLSRLRLDECQWVTAAGLKAFAGTNLLSLSLRKCRLQRRDVEHLAELKRLGTLDVTGAGLLKEDIERLQKLLPDCKITP